LEQQNGPASGRQSGLFRCEAWRGSCRSPDAVGRLRGGVGYSAVGDRQHRVPWPCAQDWRWREAMARWGRAARRLKDIDAPVGGGENETGRGDMTWRSFRMAGGRVLLSPGSEDCGAHTFWSAPTPKRAIFRVFRCLAQFASSMVRTKFWLVGRHKDPGGWRHDDVPAATMSAAARGYFLARPQPGPCCSAP